MQLDQFKDSPEYQKIHQQMVSLGLTGHLGQLEEEGYTVIPPELVAPEEFQQRLRQAVLDVHERRSGQKIDLADIASAKLSQDTPANGHWAILTEDPIFQDVIMNPTVVAMAKYLCGNRVVLSDLLCLLKQQDDRPTHRLHTDQHGTPPPLPPYSQVANVTWAMTEYTKENGALAIVPKSHLKPRYPVPEEADFLRDDAPVKPIAVEAAAGSLIVWHGATWHGSYPRKEPGLRLNLIMVFTRVYMKQIRDFRSAVSQEILAKHPVEFAQLIGANSAYPFDDGKMPPPEDIAYMVGAGSNPWA